MFNNKWGFCEPRQDGCGCGNPGQSPIMEPAITNCVEKEFYHEVPHVCPFHTHVINKHIYKHTYTPQYTCSEENQVINMDCGSCCSGQF